MSSATVTTRVSSETATANVYYFTQADGSAAQGIVPVSAAGVPAAFVNQPNPSYTGTAVQVAVSGFITDASGAGGFGAYYGFNQLGVFDDRIGGSSQLTAGQTGGVRMTAFRANHVNLRDSVGTEVMDTTQHAVRVTQYSTTGTAISMAANGSLNVTIVGGGGTGGTAVVDSSTFTVASGQLTPIGGIYNDAASPVGSGSAVTVRMTAYRGAHVNLRSSAGTEISSTAQGWLMVSNQTLQDVEGPTSAGVAVSTKPLLDGGYGSLSPLTAVTNGQHQYLWVDLNGRARVGANVSSVYGNLTQPITCTLANLNAGTAVSRSSAAIDNTGNNFLDALVTININGGTPADSSNKQALLWAYGSINGGTNYTEGNSGIGTDAAYAMNNPTALRFLGAVPMPYASKVYTGGPFSVAAAFDGILPPRWGIVVQNDSGNPFAATNSSAIYAGVARQLV